MTLLVLVLLFPVVFFFSDFLKPICLKEGETPFLIALNMLGVLYILAVFVERSLEVVINLWRQDEKSVLVQNVESVNDNDKPEARKKLEDYKSCTQRLALFAGLALGILVSLSGVRLLGQIFELATESSFQLTAFMFADIVVTTGLIAGGSTTIHELTKFIEDFLKASRERAK